MKYNGEDKTVDKIEANYIIRKNCADTYIKISSKDGLSIALTFNDKNYDPRNININETIDLIKCIYWDVTLLDIKNYFLFDITKEKALLTRIDENLFMLVVDINNPDIIYTPSNNKDEFKSLYIEETISFKYSD